MSIEDQVPDERRRCTRGLKRPRCNPAGADWCACWWESKNPADFDRIYIETQKRVDSATPVY